MSGIKISKSYEYFEVTVPAFRIRLHLKMLNDPRTISMILEENMLVLIQKAIKDMRE